MKNPMRLFVLAVLLCTASAWASADTIDWGQLGPSGTLVATGQTWVSTGGVVGEIGITNSNIGDFNMERLDQGNGWNGNFDPGEHLMWNMGGFQQTNIDIGLLFLSNYSGTVSTHIQADFFGPFEAIATVYDTFGNVIGQTIEFGTSDTNPGTALAISVHGSNIGFVDYAVVDQFGGDSLAIGTVTLGSTPEPGSLLLLGSGVLGLIGYGRKRLGF